jgi:hypothetical protein
MLELIVSKTVVQYAIYSRSIFESQHPLLFLELILWDNTFHILSVISWLICFFAAKSLKALLATTVTRRFTPLQATSRLGETRAEQTPPVMFVPARASCEQMSLFLSIGVR